MVKHLRILMLLLMTIVVGGGYAQEAITYTVASASLVTASKQIEGVTASFKNTYNNKEQLTKGNSMTLTIKGYPYEVSQIQLNLKRNKKDGDGTLSVAIGGQNVLNKKIANGDITNAYKSYSYDITSTGVVGEDIVITLSATTNSLYCNSFTIIPVSSKKSTTLTFGSDNDNKTFSLSVGDAFTAPTATLTPAEAGTITYSTSNENVAAVDATTGAVTLGETAGTATIIASFAGNDTYAASSASYTIKLKKTSVLFSANNKSFNGISGISGNGYKSGNVELIDENGDKFSFALSDCMLSKDALQMKAISGQLTSPTFNFPYGYDIIVKYNSTADMTLTIDGTTVKGTNGVLSATSNGDYPFVLKAGNKYATVSSIEIVKKQTASDVTLHVGPTGYATLYYSDRALTVPENAEATTYSAEFGEGLEVSTHYEEGQVIPAGEAVVIYALEEGDYTFKVADGSSVTKDYANMLFGTDDETAVENDDTYYFYKLSLDSNGKNVGFYWGAENGTAFTNGAHKAYLKVTKENAANAKAFVFGGDPTGVKTITTQVKTNAPLYNLAGQRVGNSYKGIVIQNGKKYVK